MDHDAWDLHAVVRSCRAMSATAVNAVGVADYDDGYYNLEGLGLGLGYGNENNNPFAFPSVGNVSGGLEDVYKAGCGQPLSAARETACTANIVNKFCQEQLPKLTDSHSFSMYAMTSQSIRPKKRKNQEKTVFQLTQEELNNDYWAWRKYGQKPIKGSPFPRNYYRCSTTKACGAKKQVERSLIDSTIFIVSYSGEHIHPRPTHRSSLAGTTRSNKFNTDIIKPPPCSSSSPASTSSFSPTTSFKEGEYEINDQEVHIQNIDVDDYRGRF